MFGEPVGSIYSIQGEYFGLLERFLASCQIFVVYCMLGRWGWRNANNEGGDLDGWCTLREEQRADAC